MIGQGYGGSAVIRAPAAEIVDPAGPIEQGVFRVNVEMNELTQPIQTLNTSYLNFYRCLT